MLKSKLKILVISHDASKTGAPILLINLIKLLQSNTNILFEIVISRGGFLEKSFSELGVTTVMKSDKYSRPGNVFEYISSRIRNKLLMLKVLVKARRSSIIFSNTSVNGQLLKWLRWSRTPVITYVHELESVFQLYHHSGHIKNSLKYTDVFLYPCQAVKNNLLHYGVNGKKLLPLDYYVPIERKQAFSNLPLLTSNGLFNIWGVGTASRRKGTDIFFETASLVNKNEQVANFYWIGNVEPSFKNEMKVLSQQRSVKFIDSLTPDKMGTIYDNMDLLFLSSREDPYPLVVLEAAAHGKPAIAFAKSGGAAEFIEDDAGWLVHEYQAQAFKKAVADILQTKNTLRIKGEIARLKHKQKHERMEFIINQFLDVIEILKNHVGIRYI